MNASDEVTMYRTAAALAVAVLCLVLPRFAQAELSHESLWGGPDSASCADQKTETPDFETFIDEHASSEHPSTDDRRGPATDVSKATLAAECFEAAPDQSEASNNLCFEKAGVPASIVPALAAQAEALDQTDALVDQARALIGFDAEADSSSARRVASRTQPVGVAPPPSQPNPDDSCTAQPDSCRSLPPLPPSLSVDATATAQQPASAIPMIPEAERPDDDDLPERLRISHSDGFDSPPLKPPRS